MAIVELMRIARKLSERTKTPERLYVLGCRRSVQWMRRNSITKLA
jgi:hypothetical protein